MKDMADYVGLVDKGAFYTFIRPRPYVHQAGTEHGVVTRPNYELHRGCNIKCGGNTLTKAEVAHWYLDDAVFFVPFVAKGDVPTNGKEEIKDHVYATPASFKTYDVAAHAVDLRDTCVNDRGQFQQFGMMTRFGLFHRPDKINFGAILLQPVQRCIELQAVCCPEDKAACIPPTKEAYAEDRGAPNSNGCDHCEGSSDTTGGGIPLSATPTPEAPNPVAFDLAEGEFQLVSINLSIVEGVDPVARLCVARVGGSLGARSIDYTTGPGTALAATNYTTAAGTLVWADGESGVKCVNVTILDANIAAALAFTFTITPDTDEVIVADMDVAAITILPTPECVTDDCVC
jgi:hypothetical protein